MRRNRWIVSILLVIGLFSLLGLTACKSQGNSLVGTWSVSLGSQAAGGGPTWEFTKDGKMIQSAGGNAQDTTATYSLSGNTLTLTTTANGASQDSTMSVQWTSSDSFKGTISGMGSTPLSFTRKK